MREIASFKPLWMTSGSPTPPGYSRVYLGTRRGMDFEQTD
jgi:hypothetical protein